LATEGTFVKAPAFCLAAFGSGSTKGPLNTAVESMDLTFTLGGNANWEAKGALKL
jgi:hypothetical protein